MNSCYKTSEISEDEIYDGKTKNFEGCGVKSHHWSYPGKQGTVVGRKAHVWCNAGFMPTRATLLRVTIN